MSTYFTYGLHNVLGIFHLQKLWAPFGDGRLVILILNEPQVQHCGLVETLLHPQIGPLQVVGHPVRVEGVRTGYQHLPPPQLGEHTDRILTELGWSEAEIQELHKAGVLHQAHRLPAGGHAGPKT